MSDTGRKDFTDKASEAIKPDSQKSYLEQAQEGLTDAGDKVAGAVQPGDSKSTSQKLTDTGSSKADDAQGAGKSYLEQAQDTASNFINSVTGEKK